MGLRIIDHLQTVFEAAQKAVIGDQRRRCRLIDAAGRGEPAQRLAGRSDPQLWHPSAPNQLLGLGEELDLADAAAPGLDIVAMDGDPGAAANRVDLPLDRMDVLDRREIEVLAPDERLELGEKTGRGDAVAGDRASLDQGCSLPV